MGRHLIGRSLFVLLALCCVGLIAETVPHATAEKNSKLPSQSPTPTPRPITFGGLPVVSPDGKRIAFVSDRTGNDDVYVISIDGRNEKQLTHTPDAEGNVAWTGDGKILFSSFKDGFSHVHVIDANGENEHELVKVPGRGVTLSRDGRRLLYMAGTW